MTEFHDWSGKRVGIEVGSRKLIAVAVEDDGCLAGSATFDLEPDGEVFERIGSLITAISGASPGLKSVGLALPGLIDRAAGRVAHATVGSVKTQKDIGSALSNETGIGVFIENDANAAALAEHRVGAGRGASNLFYITLGEGVGGAIVMHGELWRGDSGYAGEFGSIAINSDGMWLEEIASAASIVRRTQNRFHQDSTSSLSRLSEENISIDAIVAAAQEEDDFAMLMLERTGTYIGTALASVINLLDIERIVIGGEIMSAGGFVIEAIRDRARAIAYPPSFQKTSILPGELGPLAAAMGVAMITP